LIRFFDTKRFTVGIAQENQICALWFVWSIWHHW